MPVSPFSGAIEDTPVRAASAKCVAPFAIALPKADGGDPG